MTWLGWFGAAALFLLVGRVLYRRRWPEGLFPVEPDREYERLRRVARRRVLPLPSPRREFTDDDRS